MLSLVSCFRCGPIDDWYRQQCLRQRNQLRTEFLESCQTDWEGEFFSKLCRRLHKIYTTNKLAKAHLEGWNAGWPVGWKTIIQYGYERILEPLCQLLELYHKEYQDKDRYEAGIEFIMGVIDAGDDDARSNAELPDSFPSSFTVEDNYPYSLKASDKWNKVSKTLESYTNPFTLE